MYAATLPSTAPLDIRAMNAAARGLLVLAALLALSLLAMKLMRLPMFDLRQIRIDGEVTRNSLATLRAQAVGKLSGNFFSVDLRQAQQSFQAVPWVRHAQVRRVFPNQLVVTLEEHRALAEWQQLRVEESGRSDEAQLVNSAGEVFDANLGDVADEQLPKLSGPPGSAAEVLAMLQRLQPLFDPMETRVMALRLSERGSWEATLDRGALDDDSDRPGAVIEIGRGSPDEVVERVKRFVATLEQTTRRYAGAELKRADLRYPQGYALKLAGVSTLPAASGAGSVVHRH